MYLPVPTRKFRQGGLFLVVSGSSHINAWISSLKRLTDDGLVIVGEGHEGKPLAKRNIVSLIR
jgi:hypothetical protein